MIKDDNGDGGGGSGGGGGGGWNFKNGKTYECHFDSKFDLLYLVYLDVTSLLDLHPLHLSSEKRINFHCFIFSFLRFLNV